MTVTSDRSTPLDSAPLDLDGAISRYADAIEAIDRAFVPESSLPEPQMPSERQILEVLIARDTLNDLLVAANGDRDCDRMCRIAGLDRRLQNLAGALAAGDLAGLRASFQPPQSAWWWFLEAPPTPERPRPRWTNFDWAWNFGTVACLIVSGSFLTQSSAAFSATVGFDLLGAFSTISQGAGLALIASGALTDRGRKVVERVAHSVGIPPHLHAEVTFGASLLLLVTSYSIHENLHLIGEWYYERGQQLERQGRWQAAEENYVRALNFNPDDSEFLLSLGNALENLGRYEEALEQYEQKVGPDFANAHARASTKGALQSKGWQGPLDAVLVNQERANLLRALQQKDVEQKLHLIPQIYMNLGIVEWVSVDFQAPQPLSPIANRHLRKAAEYFQQASDREHKLHWGEVPDRAVWKETIAGCYLGKAKMVNFIFNVRSKNGKILQQGYDPRILRGKGWYVCHPLFESSGDLGAWQDMSIINGLQNSGSMVRYFFGPDRGFVRATVRERDRMGELQAKLRSQLQWRLRDLPRGAGKVIFRVMVNPEGEIVEYYTYDETSRQAAFNTIYETWHSNFQNEAIDRRPLADFKIILRSDGTTEVLPWAAAYRADTPNVSGLVPVPVPKPLDIAEKSVLQALLFAQIDSMIQLDELERDRVVYDEQLIYRVDITLRGEIVKARQMNSEAFENLREHPLQSFQRARHARFVGDETISFRVTFSSSHSFKVSPI